jgi:hypothetical protein
VETLRVPAHNGVVQRDGSERERETMTDHRKTLKQAYKEMKTEAGVYQIKNTINQKVLVAATPNLRTLQGKRFQLHIGSHKNAQLQAEWKHALSSGAESPFILHGQSIIIIMLPGIDMQTKP